MIESNSQNENNKKEPILLKDEMATEKHIHHYPKKRSHVGPVILILLGVILLLSNLGIDFNWNILWPSIIIIIGLILLIGRDTVGGWVIAVLIIAIAGGLIYTLSTTDWGKDIGINFGDFRFDFSFDKIDVKTKQINIEQNDYPDAKKINLSVDLGIGTYTLSNNDDDKNIFWSESAYNYSNLEPILNQSYEDNILNLQFTTIEDRSFNLFGYTDLKADYNLKLGQSDIITDFDLNIGTGTAIIDLNNQNYSKLDTHIGTGNITVNLAGTNESVSMIKFDVGTGKLNFNGLGSANTDEILGEFGTGTVTLNFDGEYSLKKMQAEIDGGTGKLIITIPKKIGFKIIPSVGTGSISINGKKINKDDDFISDNYEKAQNLIDFKLEIGTGSIEIAIPE